MTRQSAYEILTSLVKSPNLIKHHLACEAAMRAIYLDIAKDEANAQEEESWGIVGLLHDADYEITKDMPNQHTIVLEERVGELVPDEIMYAIKSHNWKNNNIEPKSPMDWAIYCCDELTGLIIAATLISPEKKLKTIDANFVINRFNEKSFAKGANRQQIKTCEEKLGIPLPDFISLVLSSMQQIAQELGL